MGFDWEIVGAPDPLVVEYEHDRNRSRVLMKTDLPSPFRSGQPNPASVDVRLTHDGTRGRPNLNDRIQMVLRDPDNSKQIIFRNTVADTPLSDFIFDTGPGDPGEATVKFFLPNEEIISQYKDGSWDELAPGEITIEIFTVDVERRSYSTSTTTTIRLTDDAKVRENVEITGVNLADNQDSFDSSVTIANPADHGVDLPLRYELASGETVIASGKTTASRLSGSRYTDPQVETRRVVRGPLDAIPYPSNTFTLRVQPTGWAEGVISGAKTSATFPGVSVSDVSIRSCSSFPETVEVGQDVTAAASVRNDLRVDADLSGVASVGADTERFTERIPAQTTQQITQAVTATTDGEPRVSLAIDSIEATR